MIQEISIDQLRQGMYLVGIDQPWHKTPFLLHRFLIRSDEEIRRLKQCGVKSVKIDVSRSKTDTSVFATEESATSSSAIEAPDDEVRPFHAPTADSFSSDVNEHSSPVHDEPPTRYLSVSPTPNARGEQSSIGVAEASAETSLEPASPVLQHKPLLANGIQPEEAEQARILFHDISSSVEDVFAGVAAGERINAAEAKRVVSTIVAEIVNTPKPLLHHMQMQALRRYDSTLFIHSLNVCVLALIVGHQEGVDHDRLQTLGLGALLHDVGHMRVPRNLLRKKGGYTKQERKILEKHPELGASLLAQSPDLEPESRRIVAEHHERVDGSGYPHGLPEHVISPLSQLVSVVDHYDTAVNGRRGHLPLPPAYALRELYKLCRTGAFQHRWVDRLIQVIGIFPVGSLVELNTGERGIVVAENPLAKTKPLITIIADPVQHAHFLVDLALPNAKPAREICRILDPVQESVRIQDYLAF